MHIVWTSRARHDLASVEEYIAQDNPDAAIETVLAIIEAVESLLQFPEQGRVGRVHNTRELIMQRLPYIVPYRLTDSTIVILRVYHSSRKWPDQF